MFMKYEELTIKHLSDLNEGARLYIPIKVDNLIGKEESLYMTLCLRLQLQKDNNDRHFIEVYTSVGPTYPHFNETELPYPILMHV